MPPLTPAQLAQNLKVKRYVLATGMVFVTVVGSWTGANLKTEYEAQKVRQKRLQATPAERIAELEDYKTGLLVQRRELERKIERVDASINGATWEESMVGRERRRGE